MKNFWQELAALNSKGVVLMQQGKLDCAEASFTQGLRILQCNVNSMEIFVPSRSSSVLSVSVFSHRMAPLNNDLVALFDRALVFSGEKLPDASTEHRFSAYTGFTLYNLALTLHLQGLLEGNAKSLSRALQMYALGWEALENTGARYMQVELGLLACTNNIAHIHRHYHRISDVTSCGQWIWQRLQDASIPKEERTMLLQNVFFYKQKDLSSAAAA